MAELNQYILPSADKSEAETCRLDSIHIAFTRYFEGKLGFAPVSEVRPKKILDIGCGSGAWAIQAAEQFPDAHILAVDMSPLPERTLPANMSFKVVDVSQGLPFEPEFDIVHERLVFCHLLNVAEVIERAARLLKPGGLLLLEEFDMSSLVKIGGPVAQRWASQYIKLCTSRGTEPGAHNVRRGWALACPCAQIIPSHERHRVGPSILDESLNALGRAMRAFSLVGAKAVSKNPSHDFPDGIFQDFLTELNDQNCTASFDMYFCWAQRTKI
ncbi:S-adenosyl-L-methionine-dependent methyltransferase [Mycena pura]|uniref:S-adenosyl-L-methionine-dependent methyltransferase n=1 Tax=Mycena pura TaxID=153505 RepID=A0AAD6YU68_9AGAR|nr:S-adenosyl-L-methionine-dependent methyltransferase [Mycena pura]